MQTTKWKKNSCNLKYHQLVIFQRSEFNTIQKNMDNVDGSKLEAKIGFLCPGNCDQSNKNDYASSMQKLCVHIFNCIYIWLTVNHSYRETKYRTPNMPFN